MHYTSLTPILPRVFTIDRVVHSNSLSISTTPTNSSSYSFSPLAYGNITKTYSARSRKALPARLQICRCRAVCGLLRRLSFSLLNLFSTISSLQPNLICNHCAMHSCCGRYKNWLLQMHNLNSHSSTPANEHH